MFLFDLNNEVEEREEEKKRDDIKFTKGEIFQLIFLVVLLSTVMGAMFFY